jgi:pyruvate dehydrogenase E2 component (dihydrolipoamide acetyltransferase)
VTITKLGMPKWGLSMREGALVAWLVEEGAELTAGDDVAEVETEKINGIVESPAAGVLRRQVARVGDVVPVGGLLGVLAEPSVSADEIDAFVADFSATFVPEAAEEEGGPAPETATVGVRTIRYLRHGDGPEEVVLIHGFGGDLATWLFNHEALARPGRSVYALDLPGHGGSSKDVASGSLGELADAVAGTLGALGLEHVHLVGHSLGGAVAAIVAAGRPGRVASLVLVASAGLGEEVNRDYVQGFVEAEGRRDLAPALELLFADPGLVTRHFVEEVLKVKRLDGVDEALRAIAGAVFPEGRQAVSITAPLAKAGFPILAIWGEEDRILPPAHAGALPKSARIEIVKGAGHMPQMEAPGEVNRLIDEFLASVTI